MNSIANQNSTLSPDYLALCNSQFELTEKSFAPVTTSAFENATVITLHQNDCDIRLDASCGASQVIFDFGEQIVGSIKLTIFCEEPAKIELFYGEDLTEARRNEDYTSGWYHLPHDVFDLEAGQRQIQNQGRRAFRYVRVQLQSPQSSSVKIHRVEAVLRHYPVTQYGQFDCSDELLNRAWEISERTTRLCMQQYYEDGIKRDGLLWVGDYRLQFLCNAVLYGDATLARKCLGMIALTQFDDGSVPACAVAGGAHQHPSNINYMFHLATDVESFFHKWMIINYVTDYVSCVREYLDYTGDIETVRELWPSAKRVLNWLNTVDIWSAKRGHDYITDVQPDFPDSWWGARGALPAHLHWAARDGAAVAQILNDEETLSLCHLVMESSQQLSEKFRDNETGLLRDDVEEGFGWHTNSLAALSGLVGAGESVDLLQQLSQRTDARYCIISFMELYRLWAEFETNRAEQALTEMRSYWGHMLRYDATSCWDACNINLEGIERPDTHAMSHCHGWGAGPAFLLPTFVLGLKPAAPGWKQIQIRPQLGDLQWARGSVPTPNGNIDVQWERVTESNVLRGTVHLPEGVSAQVVVNGREYSLEAGRHEIAP